MGLSALQMCAGARCVPGPEVSQGHGHSCGWSLWHLLVGGCVDEAQGSFTLLRVMSPEGWGHALCRVTKGMGTCVVPCPRQNCLLWHQTVGHHQDSLVPRPPPAPQGFCCLVLRLRSPMESLKLPRAV